MAIWSQLPTELVGEIANKILDDIEDRFIDCVIHSDFREDTVAIHLYKVADINKLIEEYTVLRLYLGMKKPPVLEIIHNIPYIIKGKIKKRARRYAVIKWKSLTNDNTYRYFIQKCANMTAAHRFMNIMLWTSMIDEKLECFHAFQDIYGSIPDYALQYGARYLPIIEMFNEHIKSAYLDGIITLLKNKIK
jgi:hypothetical protein